MPDEKLTTFASVTSFLKDSTAYQRLKKNLEEWVCPQNRTETIDARQVQQENDQMELSEHVLELVIASKKLKMLERLMCVFEEMMDPDSPYRSLEWSCISETDVTYSL